MNKIKKPWPTKAAMTQVYLMKLWGGIESDYYSGEGSHDPELVRPYVDVVASFLTSFESPLVARNKEKFKNSNLEFHCLDIAADDLPSGDCALVRQVLQHLSNAEVQSIASKLAGFKYVIVTEHLPVGSFIPNKEIISGQGVRIKKQSGINLVASPFNFKVKEEKELSSVILRDGTGVIVTTLYVNF